MLMGLKQNQKLKKAVLVLQFFASKDKTQKQIVYLKQQKLFQALENRYAVAAKKAVKRFQENKSRLQSAEAVWKQRLLKLFKHL